MTEKTLTPKQETLASISRLSEHKRRVEAAPCYLYVMEAEGSTPLHGWGDNRKAAHDLEKLCHKLLDPLRAEGEWFEAPKEAVEAAAALAAIATVVSMGFNPWEA